MKRKLSKLLVMFLCLTIMLCLSGCGTRSEQRMQNTPGLGKNSVKLQKPPKRQRLFLPPKSQSKTDDSAQPVRTEDASTPTEKTLSESEPGTTNGTGRTGASQIASSAGKASYAKELKAYQKAMSKLKGKSFVMKMEADIDLEAYERGRREYATENIDLTANIRKNQSKRMEMSGTCRVSAPGTTLSYNYYHQGDTAYIEYTSPRYAKVQVDELPTASLMNYQFDIEKDDIRYGEKAEDGVVLLVDGSALDLQTRLEELVSSFDSVSCDAVELQLWTDRKGRPTELDMFYTVEFTLGDASATADYEETLTFTNYGKAKINKPAELTQNVLQPGEVTGLDIKLDEELELLPDETNTETEDGSPDERDGEQNGFIENEIEGDSSDRAGDESSRQEPPVDKNEGINEAEDNAGETSQKGEAGDLSEDSEMRASKVKSDEPKDAYEAILDEYRRACAASMEEFRENAETEYPHVNYDVVEDYHISFHESWEGDEIFELCYAYYDIDENGTDELIIYRAFHELYICDLYAFDGEQAVKLFPDVTLLGDEVDTVYVHIYKSGDILEQSGDSSWYRLAENGYSLESSPGTYVEAEEAFPDWQVLAEDIDGGTVADDGDSPVAEAYREKLSELAGEEAYYTLCDITEDGVEELIVSITDVEGDGGTYHFYTFNGDYLEEIGTLDRLGSILYRDEDGGLILCRLSEDAGQIDRISYDGAEIVTTCLSEYNSEDEDDTDWEENLFEEWERSNDSYLSEMLEPLPVTDTGLLEQTFGTGGEEAEWSSDKPELSDYLWSVEEFHQLVGGEPSDEVGDHENWYIGEGIQYGNYIDSNRIDEIVMESSEYQLFGVAAGEDVEQARERLEQDGWIITDEYEGDYTFARDGEKLGLSFEYGDITNISFWRESEE